MMSLEDTESMFHQVLSHKRYCFTTYAAIVIIDLSFESEFWPSSIIIHFFLSFRTGNPPIVNKTAVPPCADEPSKKVFEQAITGALRKGLIGCVVR